MTTRINVLSRLTGFVFLMVLAASAEAHPGHAQLALRDGFLHPWLGWDHWLAMLAVGLWARQTQTGSAVWRLPATFILAAALGACGGHLLGAASLQEPLIASGIIVLGALLVFTVRLPAYAGFMLLALMGASHGWAHGTEMPMQASAVPFAAGFIAATALLHAAGVFIASQLLARGASTPLRLAGVGVAVAGCGLLALG